MYKLMFPAINYSKIISCFLLIGILYPCYSNNYDPVKAEDSLMILFKELAGANSPDKQKLLNISIIDILQETLKNPGSFDYPFDSIQSLGKVYSQDRSLRIYSWNYSESPVRHKYSGFLQLRDQGSNEIGLFFLNHEETAREDMENRTFTHKNWYGALYYQVHTVHYDNRKFYTLIGFDFNNSFTNIKIIDVLTFIDDNPVFGSPIFKFKDGIRHRVVFEYSAGVVMFARYVANLDLIVYDHLSPSLPRFGGQYRYYGPDLSYDALRFEHGSWVHVSDIQWNK
jgi:hypothetical protein